MNHTQATTVRPAPRPRRQTKSDSETRIPLHLPHPERVCKLDANECTRRPAQKVLDALTRWIGNGPLNWCPDTDAVRLRTALAGYTGLSFENVRAFNTTDELLADLARVLIERGDEALIVPPISWHFPQQIEHCGGRVTKIITSDLFAADLSAVLDAVGPQTRLLYLAGPNEFTGVYYQNDQIETILKTHPYLDVIVDETYYEFSGMTAAELVKTYSNIWIIRSFTPAFGLGSLCLSYLLTQPKNLAVFGQKSLGLTVTSPAQVAGRAALGAIDETREYVHKVKKNMTNLDLTLTGLGLTVVTTAANFILVRVACPAQVADYLAGQLVFVKNCDPIPGLEGFLRITVGDREITNRVLSAFLRMPRDILGTRGVRRPITLFRDSEENSGTAWVSPQTAEHIDRRFTYSGRQIQ